jgi:hypothetical protein
MRWERNIAPLREAESMYRGNRSIRDEQLPGFLRATASHETLSATGIDSHPVSRFPADCAIGINQPAHFRGLSRISVFRLARLPTYRHSRLR